MDARVTPQSYSPSAGALCPPRSWLTDEPTISLNGSWDFVHHTRLPDPFDDPEKPSPCPVLGPCAERIDVPSHWVMAPHGRWGSPAYTNVDFPFPVDPPILRPTTPSATTAVPSTSPPNGWGTGRSACASTAWSPRRACG